MHGFKPILTIYTSNIVVFLRNNSSFWQGILSDDVSIIYDVIMKTLIKLCP